VEDLGTYLSSSRPVPSSARPAGPHATRDARPGAAPSPWRDLAKVASAARLQQSLDHVTGETTDHRAVDAMRRSVLAYHGARLGLIRHPLLDVCERSSFADLDPLDVDLGWPNQTYSLLSARGAISSSHLSNAHSSASGNTRTRNVSSRRFLGLRAPAAGPSLVLACSSSRTSGR